MAFNVKRVVLNPRAYLTPFVLLVLLHHLPMLIAFGAIHKPPTYAQCGRLRDLVSWLDVAFALHLVTAVLLLASCTMTLCSSVYRVHKPETALILMLFLLYVTHLVWAVYGESAFPADTIDCSNDTDPRVQDAADDITYFQHFDFVFSLVVVVLASCTSYLCGVHTSQDIVEAEKRWQRRCMNMFRVFTCRSTRAHHTTDEDIFESLGKMLGKFFVVRYKTQHYEGLQFNDLMFCLGLVSRAQRQEREDDEEAELAARRRFPKVVEETKLRDLSFYARLAIGMYGWPMFVWYTPLKWFRVFDWVSRIREFSSRRRQEAEEAEGGRVTGVVENDNIVTSNRASFVSYTGINPDALVYLNCYNFVFSSPYSIVKDEQRRELIISVRGSFSFYDFVTDGLAHIVNMDPFELPENVPDPEATATHYGMLRTARSLFKDLQQGTRQALFWEFASAHCRAGATEPWTITVCGHSMGAGVGAILCVLLRREFPMTRAFLYAPPMLFDPVTAHWTKSFMTTAVFSDDIVPRLSIANVTRLRDEMIDHFNAVSAEKLYKVRYGKRKPVAPRDKGSRSAHVAQLEIDATGSTAPASPLVDVDVDPATASSTRLPVDGLLSMDFLQTAELDDVQEVDVPGEIVHILTAQRARTCGCTMLRGEQALTYTLREASHFRRIRVNARALQDHMVHHYDRNIRHLTANCLGIPLVDDANQILVDVDPEEAAATMSLRAAARVPVAVARPPVTLESAPSYDVIGDFEATAATDDDGKLHVRKATAAATPRRDQDAAAPYLRMDDDNIV